ncbi:hypothetical protein Airi02_050460 [Actinoallomurus iriomotensis]|uniref:Uncharacterized protein n=1 Tax=Actinoallomurus iriomotensis TaxID=478107 RepID=A0A9W6S7H2_9ACTN|nr:hypothetical protein Airi02_050460 [Actinoallomurus iriomotensis]
MPHLQGVLHFLESSPLYLLGETLRKESDYRSFFFGANRSPHPLTPPDRAKAFPSTRWTNVYSTTTGREYRMENAASRP